MMIPRCFRLLFLQEMLSLLKVMVVAAITHLGLLKPPPAAEDPTTRYVLLMDGTCPSPVPVSIHVLQTLIKRKLPVVTYQSFLEKMGDRHGGNPDGTTCSVCLEEVEGHDHIRELSNCCHVFHAKCLESWVDEGQVSCPLCRSMLFEEKTVVGEARIIHRQMLLSLSHHQH